MTLATKSTISGTYSLTRVSTSGGRTWIPHRTAVTEGRPSQPVSPRRTHVQGLHVLVELLLPELGQTEEDGVLRHLTSSLSVQPVRQQVFGVLQQRLTAKKQQVGKTLDLSPPGLLGPTWASGRSASSAARASSAACSGCRAALTAASSRSSICFLSGSAVAANWA